MIGKLDPDIERFIDHRIHSPLDIDIIVYFHENPIAVESAKGVAKRLGKNVKEVAEALHRFESRGVVRNMATKGASLYTYSAGDNLSSVINRFVRLVTCRQGREIVDNKLIVDGKL